MMVVQCKDCHARSFVAALVGEATSASPIGQLYDLATSNQPFDYPAPDVRDEIDAEPVSVDDVLTMHEFLEEFDGDFRKLLRS